MTALDMLANWPGWEKKTADELLTSPAWSMMVRYGDDEMRLRVSGTAPRDVIGLCIAFDGEEHFLGLGNRETFSDLNILWHEKKRLPDALILALIEKECGNLLQLLENAVRSQLSVIGLADADERSGTQGFEVINAKGEIVVFFSMTLSKMIKRAFGDVANIDTNHPDIRAMEMPSQIQYASFLLNDAEAKSIASGDYLLLPEAANLSGARWLPQGAPKDGRFYVVADKTAALTFGALADGVLPEIPKPERLLLIRDGKTIAAGVFSRLGGQPAFAIEEVI